VVLPFYGGGIRSAPFSLGVMHALPCNQSQKEIAEVPGTSVIDLETIGIVHKFSRRTYFF
jgi:hypothetical protein